MQIADVLHQSRPSAAGRNLALAPVKMRAHIATLVALISVGVTPVVSQASPITMESMLPDLTAAADGGYSPLLDDSGDPVLLLAGVNAFAPPGTHGKLRGGSPHDGIVFTPTGGAWGGSWNAFGGSNPGGGPPGPAPGSFTLLSFSTQNTGPDQSQNPDPNQGFPPSLNLGFESGATFSTESCCEENTTAVPEPAPIVLVAGGIAMSLRRAIARRAR